MTDRPIAGMAHQMFTIELRDLFAAAALMGELACPFDGSPDKNVWARIAYEYADAMLVARGPVKQEPTPEDSL